MYDYILLFHVIAATVWTGGHLVLALTVLPRALRAKDPAFLLQFESGYEKVGMPALVVQVLSGLWLAKAMVPQVADWLSFDGSPERLVAFKLLMMAVTIVIALDTRLRLIPRLTPASLPTLAGRIVVVTVIAVAFVVVGVSFRGGLLA